MAVARPLTRNEAKAVTRGRLLEAATRVLRERGYGGLSASAVARAAGVAQPTFYVHFRDKADLLRALGEEHVGTLRERLRRARAQVIAGHGVDAVRETFRLPLATWVEHPHLFRLFAQERRQPGSPLGALFRELLDEVRNDLADDLVRLGLPGATPADRERVQMVAEAMIAQTEALALGHLDDRYTSFDAVVEVLTEFAVGVLAGTPPPA